MTGWRIGYTAGNEKVIKAMAKLQGQSTSCPNSVAQVAAVEALMGDQSEITKMRNIFKSRRNYIVDRLNNIDGVTCSLPGGAFYVFPDFSNYIGRGAIANSNDLSVQFNEDPLGVIPTGS